MGKTLRTFLRWNSFSNVKIELYHCQIKQWKINTIWTEVKLIENCWRLKFSDNSQIWSLKQKQTKATWMIASLSYPVYFVKTKLTNKGVSNVHLSLKWSVNASISLSSMCMVTARHTKLLTSKYLPLYIATKLWHQTYQMLRKLYIVFIVACCGNYEISLTLTTDNAARRCHA